MRPRDAIALIIAISICVGILLTALQPIFVGEHISDERGEKIYMLVAALVSILAAYVGTKED